MCLQDSSSSLTHQSTTASYRRFLITAGNYLGLRISSRYSNKRQSRGDYPCHKFYQARKRSSCKRLLWWPMHTHGSFSKTSRSRNTRWINARHSSSSNQKLSQMRELIETFTTPWCYFLQRFWKMLLIHRSWWSLRKKSTDFTDQMLSTLQSVKFTWNTRKNFILSLQKCQMLNQRTTRKDKKEYFYDRKFQKKPERSNSKETRVRLGHFIQKCLLTVLSKVDHLWYLSSFQVLRTRSNFSKMKARRKKLKEHKALHLSSEVT